MAVQKITTENFDEFIKNNETALVDFFATWCGPCKIMSPTIDEIAEENPNVAVAKCDTDQAMEIAQRYGIMSIPTIMIFRGGEEAKRFVGVTPKQDIVDELN